MDIFWKVLILLLILYVFLAISLSLNLCTEDIYQQGSCYLQDYDPKNNKPQSPYMKDINPFYYGLTISTLSIVLFNSYWRKLINKDYTKKLLEYNGLCFQKVSREFDNYWEPPVFKCLLRYCFKFYSLELSNEHIEFVENNKSGLYIRLWNPFSNEFFHLESHNYNLKPGSKFELTDIATVPNLKNIKLQQKIYKNSGTIALIYNLLFFSWRKFLRNGNGKVFKINECENNICTYGYYIFSNSLIVLFILNLIPILLGLYMKNIIKADDILPDKHFSLMIDEERICLYKLFMHNILNIKDFFNLKPIAENKSKSLKAEAVATLVLDYLGINRGLKGMSRHRNFALAYLKKFQEFEKVYIETNAVGVPDVLPAIVFSEEFDKEQIKCDLIPEISPVEIVSEVRKEKEKDCFGRLFLKRAGGLSKLNPKKSESLIQRAVEVLMKKKMIVKHTLNRKKSQIMKRNLLEKDKKNCIEFEKLINSNKIPKRIFFFEGHKTYELRKTWIDQFQANTFKWLNRFDKPISRFKNDNSELNGIHLLKYLFKLKEILFTIKYNNLIKYLIIKRDRITYLKRSTYHCVYRTEVMSYLSCLSAC